jgi:hypothetical protein
MNIIYVQLFTSVILCDSSFSCQSCVHDSRYLRTHPIALFPYIFNTVPIARKLFLKIHDSDLDVLGVLKTFLVTPHLSCLAPTAAMSCCHLPGAKGFITSEIIQQMALLLPSARSQEFHRSWNYTNAATCCYLSILKLNIRWRCYRELLPSVISQKLFSSEIIQQMALLLNAATAYFIEVSWHMLGTESFIALLLHKGQ